MGMTLAYTRLWPEIAPLLESRIAASAQERGGTVTGTGQFYEWFDDCSARFRTSAQPRPLTDLTGWRVDPDTGNVIHDSGRFFQVEGIDVHRPGGPVERWQQPTIHQPEVGILGILVKEFDGVLHCLMQAKAEPGNCNGVELSPTVQATRSNYTRVHRGLPVPYLEYFQDVSEHNVIVDVRQSEQGAWFRQKRNRNVVVETTADVELRDGFCWLTLGQLYDLLSVDHLINMDSRTVLSCLPIAGMEQAANGRGPFHHALLRSCGGEQARHTMREILSWITNARTRQNIYVVPMPLRSVQRWNHVDGRIAHELGLFFDVVGVAVEATGREVAHWHQPMIAPRGDGLAALLVRRIDGVLHVLMHARVAPGYVDVLELGPTVQCQPRTSDRLGEAMRPAFLTEVLEAGQEQIRFDAVHSEEGGRFLNARTRYVVVETDLDVGAEEYPDHRWMTLHQLSDLMQHSHYLNVEARSLMACLHSLVADRPSKRGSAGPEPREGAHR
jgi:dTDP-4-dehydro-6-deoxy-alpha-D-glucopyranose 2,3-dehydratase